MVSIRKRLILSNIAMIMIPVFLFILSGVLLVSIFFGDISGPWNSTEKPVNKEFIQLKKIASLTPEKLSDQNYLSEVEQKLRAMDISLIIRRGDEFIYQSPDVKELSISDLPMFGQIENMRPVQWTANHHYNLQSYDFYYQNGTEGTIFLAGDAGSIADFGRKFFPLLFGTFLLILITTNGLLSYFVSKSIIKPVNELMQGAQKIADGNLNFQIKSTEKDELGKLSQAFDHMRQKLKESTVLQLQYEENRKELISNISHDLKTPITSIKGYVEGIRDGVANTPEKMERYLQTIYTKSMDMDKLIDELALYSKLDLNRLPFEFEKVDFKAFLSDLLDGLKFDFENDGVSLTFNAEKDTAYHVNIDKEKMKRVITNIIHNSLKYMDKDEKKIQVYLKVSNSNVFVQIIDNGPGIPENALPFIFDRFYRADPSRNTGTGGSGLGLAIVKKIIEEHGGEIWVESERGEGTSILFTIKKSLSRCV